MKKGKIVVVTALVYGNANISPKTFVVDLNKVTPEWKAAIKNSLPGMASGGVAMPSEYESLNEATVDLPATVDEVTIVYWNSDD